MPVQLTGNALREHYQSLVNSGALNREKLLIKYIELGWILLKEERDHITFMSPDSFRFRIFFNQTPSIPDEQTVEQSAQAIKKYERKVFAPSPNEIEFLDLYLIYARTPKGIIAYFGHTLSLQKRLRGHMAQDPKAEPGHFASDVYRASGGKVMVTVLDRTPDDRFIPPLRAMWFMAFARAKFYMPSLKRVPAPAKAYQGPIFIPDNIVDSILTSAITVGVPIDHAINSTPDALYARTIQFGKKNV